jgi:hypothetical protein
MRRKKIEREKTKGKKEREETYTACLGVDGRNKKKEDTSG